MGGGSRRAAAERAKTLRVGTQKGAPILMAVRRQRGLEALLAPLGIEVQWTEFQFGPPILEAMRAGSVDLGLVGDTPPIFAQAAKSDLLYVAAVPPLQTLRDLKGKRIAFARGSSAHNLTIAAIDAWTIWDPFYALYETRPGVQVLVASTGIAPQNSFFIASRSYTETNPDVAAAVLSELARTGTWAREHPEDIARLATEATLSAIRRAPTDVLPVAAAHVRSQQDIADRFHRLGIVPASISVAERVWTWKPSA